MEFFDRAGGATAYTPAGTHLFLWSGTPVAYLVEDKVYTFRGQLLGWHENGWLYDLGNRPALFSAGAVGGPAHQKGKAGKERPSSEASEINSSGRKGSARSVAVVVAGCRRGLLQPGMRAHLVGEV
jgi:hypothetical protein